MIPPNPKLLNRMRLDTFLAEAAIASLRAGATGTVAACDAITAAKTLTREAGVVWDREAQP